MLQNRSNAFLAHQKIMHQLPHFKPRIGIVLGSGLGRIADEIEDPCIIPYEILPGFPTSHVNGHHNRLILGKMNGIEVACLQGRAHGYEGDCSEAVKTYVRTLRLLGCEYFIATNASGSMHESIGPGALMLITDHINLQPSNPLIGPNDTEFGPRFYPLDNAYNLNMRKDLLTLASDLDITLHQGVYVAVSGPHYETAAEIKAFRMLGADAVGMSTVPEVLVANHCGMKVAVIASITNYATGLAKESHCHDAVVKTADDASRQLSRLLIAYVSTCEA